MDTISFVFIIFQAVAWVTILLSIINLVFKKNIASISSSMRVDVMLSLQRFVLAGMVLAMLFPVINVVFKFSYLLTDIFSKIMVSEAKSTFFASVPMYGNSLASILTYCAYFVALVTVNITYIIRGIVVAVLVAASPIFVVFMTLGDNYKKVTTEWIKNLLSNLFIQPIQALVLGFLMSIPFTGIRGIEALVYIYAMIPISETIRHIIFSQSGAGTVSTAGTIEKAGVGAGLHAITNIKKTANKGVKQISRAREETINKNKFDAERQAAANIQNNNANAANFNSNSTTTGSAENNAPNNSKREFSTSSNFQENKRKNFDKFK